MLRIDLATGKVVDISRDGVRLARLTALEVRDDGRAAYLLATHYRPDGSVLAEGVRHVESGQMFGLSLTAEAPCRIVVGLPPDHARPQVRLLFNAPGLEINRPEYLAKLARRLPLLNA